MSKPVNINSSLPTPRHWSKAIQEYTTDYSSMGAITGSGGILSVPRRPQTALSFSEVYLLQTAHILKEFLFRH